MEFRLLGPFEVAADGRVLDIGSPKQRTILAMLVLNLNRVVALDALVEELWGGLAPASAVPTIQSLVSRLRRTLSPSDDSTKKVALRSREPGYVLEADPGLVDAHRFEGLVARAREALARSEPEPAAADLAEALGLWRGPALAGLADRDFARLEATRLDEARLAAIEELTDAELALGRPGEALTLLESHVAAHPLRERAWGQLMLALYRLGRQAEALRAYQHVRRLLVEELGVEPTPWLRGLEDQVLHQSPELDGPLRTGTGGPPSTPPEPVPPRPAGDTVVFLFTDIEASTRRWEGQQDEMARDLARHDELLRKAVESAQGHVFGHVGDGLCAAFPTARTALEAAVAGQQALLDQKWSQTRPLRVRMAVHAGSAERHGDTYIGPTLNRVARLLSIASGGQVLCSQATVDLARDDVPVGVTLLDLGEHALADLARPEHVFQLGHPQLPAGFPPLRSPGARRSNLPAALTPFVGRAAELEDLVHLLGSARLVTLTGVGGAGKTRLAAEAAARTTEDFPDGVWLVELGPLRDPSLVVAEVTAAVGLEACGLARVDGASDDFLCDQLRTRRLLLVLDNCEHLIEPVARLAHAILARCPDVTVVATSREVLGLPGEVVWGVPPLSLPPADPVGPVDLAGSDAVALFCERAGRAGFGLSAANAVAVAQICRRLDGIPLALELAAARIRVLGAQQLAARLDDRFRLLTGGARTAVPRHQTLRAAMDWSYHLLPAPEQVALRRLSVFPDSFDLEAAEAVVGSPAAGEPAGPGFEVLDLLARLVDKSLVTVQADSGDVRYRLLETVRQYAGEKLAEAGETAAAHRRHRDFFHGVAAERTGRLRWEIGRWVANHLVSDYANYRAALEWSLDEGDEETAVEVASWLWAYWLWSGRREGLERLERALAGPARPATPARAEALSGLAHLIKVSGTDDLDRCRELLQEAEDLGVRLHDGNAVARARYVLAEVSLTGVDVPAARELFGSVLEWCDANDSPVGAAWCHYSLGWVAVAGGDQVRARTHFERGLEAVRHHDGVVIPHILGALATVTAATGERERAQTLAQEAVVAARGFSLRGILAMALTRATETAILSGDGRRAETWLYELLGLLRELGSRRWMADALEMAALVRQAAGDDEGAARLLGACEAVRAALGEPAGGLRLISEKVRECRTRVTEVLGAEGFAAREDEGRKMSLEEALSYALTAPAPAPASLS
jgi:predicted ATPase/DNA-binding SARP family transcriptional activator/class 3 adenylate cyclase